MKILIVDDNPDIIVMLKECVKRLDHEVLVSENVQDAFRLLKEYKIDMGFFDYFIGQDSGIHLLNRARMIRPQARYIIMTGEGGDWARRESEISGAVRFLRKPVHLGQIREILESFAD